MTSTERNKGERNGGPSVVYGAVRMAKPAANFKINKQWQTILKQINSDGEKLIVS
jgi:hypothetical protein